MLLPIPVPEQFQVSTKTGFLPSEIPLQKLTHPIYDKWEQLVANLQSLLLGRRLRPLIDKLPVIPATHLDTEPEWRRAYLVLIFLSHGYIWGGEKPAQILPPSITYPLLQVCEHLELPPVATYAGLVLWNWKTLFLRDGVTLENLSTLATYTGSLDEQWFYLVSVAIEAKGGSAIPLMLDAISAAREGDKDRVTANLRESAEIIDELGTLLVRMYDNCDPHVFYHRIRPYLAGSKNMRDAGLPQGIFYDDGSDNSSWQQYGGGSNAQSSLLQFFDIVLGVEHRPTGSKQSETSESETEPGQPPKPRHSFIHEMRQYMPGPHRRFLQAVESVTNIRDYVEYNKHDRNLTLAYDACLAMLRALRDKHIQIVSRYIIVKSREARSVSRSRGRTAADMPESAPARGRGIASISYKESNDPAVKKKKIRGTGGTALIPFLKQARDETGEPAIDAWARKVLTGGRRSEADQEISIESFRLESEEVLEGLERIPTIVGLAGVWDMETEGGGLCAY